MSASRGATDGRPHILVMDDVQEIVDLLREVLEEEGYRVSTSLVVPDLEQVKAIGPDLVVADVLFDGDEQGWRFLAAARRDRELRRLPLILCTAAVRAVDEMRELLDAHDVAVVRKPFDIDELVLAVRAKVGSVG